MRTLKRDCTVADCPNRTNHQLWCNTHYARWQKHGDVQAHIPIRRMSGGTRTKDGYIVLSKPDHPNARKHGKIYEHTVVMSEQLGRALYPDENVHHINGVRDDNRPENLELWTTKQPPGQRVEDKVVWALEILRRYAPETLA